MNRRIQAAAWLIDTTADRLLAHRDYGEDGVVVIGPDGKKHVLANAQIEKALLALKMPAVKGTVQQPDLSTSENHGRKSRGRLKQR